MWPNSTLDSGAGGFGGWVGQCRLSISRWKWWVEKDVQGLPEKKNYPWAPGSCHTQVGCVPSPCLPVSQVWL